MGGNSQPEAKHRMLSVLWAAGEVDHLFGALARYTRFVVYGKWTLAVVALVLILSLIAWPLLTKERSGLRISFSDRGQTEGGGAAKPVMNNPKYHGINDDGDQYAVNGLSATQQSENWIAIKDVEGQLIKRDGSWYSLTAKDALYDQNTKIIYLSGDVTVLDAKGTQFASEKAVVETATSLIYGDAPVTGTGDFGNLVASGFKIMDKGRQVRFTGSATPVKVKLDKAGKRKE